MISTVFLDLDGVVADFIGGVRKMYENGDFLPRDLHDIDAPYLKPWPEEWPAGEWDVCEVADISTEMLWERIAENKRFWSSLDYYPWAQSLVNVLGAFAAETVIATSPCRDHQCAAGKIFWLRGLLGDPNAMNFVISPHKHFLAAPGRVLIDDNDRNCDRFIEHGGEAILFPQPWNSLHGFEGDRLHYVLQRLAEISAKAA